MVNFSFGLMSFIAQTFSHSDMVFYGSFLYWFPRTSVTVCRSVASARMHYLTVLEVASLKSRCQHRCFSSEDLEGDPSVLRWRLLALSLTTVIPAFVLSPHSLLPVSSRRLFNGSSTVLVVGHIGHP